MQTFPAEQFREDLAITADGALTANGAITQPSLGRRSFDAPAGLQSRRSGRLNVVLICHFGRTGYNILRSLRSVNARVYLVHDNRSASLRFSRCCKVLHGTEDYTTADVDVVLDRINDLHLRVGVDSVIASDVDALTFLARIKGRLLAPVFPMAEAETLALLNDKWQFHQLCETAGVELPKTLYFGSKAGIDPNLIERELAFPVIVKPVDSYGQRGIIVWQNKAQIEAWLQTAGDFDHQATIVQEFIEGKDWALSVFAANGVIKHWVSWVCPGQLDAGYGIGRFLATQFSPREDLLAMGQKIVAATQFSGVANFDARFDERSRSMKMFECNPRFFNRMSAARLSGVDFVRPGLPISDTQPTYLGDISYYPWQELFSKRGIKRLMRAEWRLRPLMRDIYEMSTDPLPLMARKWSNEDKRA
jgi:predicted ATP-grasp superfamily ATP-dependent carboligase